MLPAPGGITGPALRANHQAGCCASPCVLRETKDVSIWCPSTGLRCNDQAEKDEFWDELQSVWQALPAREPAWILGDFNSRIGINTAAAPSPAAEGVHGERFLHFCSEAHLKVLNTFFQHSADELTSWVHRRWGTQGMIDYAVGRATDWCYVLDTHSLPHAEVNSDHRLMVLKLRYVRAAPTATCDKRLPRLCVAKLLEGDTST